MRCLTYLKGHLIVAVLLVTAPGLTERVSCQSTTEGTEDLNILRDVSVREKYPALVAAAIDRVSRPILAKPIDRREEIPSEVIAAFVGLLDFGVTRNGDPNFDISAGTLVYPAVETLRVIGKPILPQLIEVLEDEEPSSVKSRNALRVVQMVLGGEKVEVSNFLFVQAEQASSDKGKRRLLDLAEHFHEPN